MCARVVCICVRVCAVHVRDMRVCVMYNMNALVVWVGDFCVLAGPCQSFQRKEDARQNGERL